MTVGAHIKQARIAAGLSVAEVAAKVRVRNSLLVAIESDNFDPCGVPLINQINIGNRTIIGAGALVHKDLPANCTAVGFPAKPIKYHNE